VHYGFFEFPDVPVTLAKTREKLADAIDLDGAVYYAERDEIVLKSHGSYWWRLQSALFAFLFRNALHALDRLNLSSQSLVEIGRRIEI
jgi:K+ transporter